MNTEIEYLKQVETDLKDAAARETARMERATLQGAIRKNTGRGWTKVVGVAAAFLVVAGAIGFLAQGGLMSSADGGGQAFQEVGGAVADGGGNSSASQAPGVGDAPAPVPTDEEHAFAPPTIPGVNEDALDTAEGGSAGSSRISRRSSGTGASASSFPTTSSVTPSVTSPSSPRSTAGSSSPRRRTTIDRERSCCGSRRSDSIEPSATSATSPPTCGSRRSEATT